MRVISTYKSMVTVLFMLLPLEFASDINATTLDHVMQSPLR